VTTPDAIALVLRAAAFAAEKHRHQRRKDVDRTPYINHPLALANLLADTGGVTDPIVLAAALLHDTIEDTETSLEELTRAFGPLIASIVQEVTDDDGLPKRTRKQLQIDRAPHLSERARLVKLADKICNLRDLAENPPPEWSPDVRRRYFDWAKEVVDALRGAHPKLEALFDAAYVEKPE
jgi:guanosine-3',5'-bis(diphosphate) 3'-pyrophosphohydrolase